MAPKQYHIYKFFSFAESLDYMLMYVGTDEHINYHIYYP